MDARRRSALKTMAGLIAAGVATPGTSANTSMITRAIPRSGEALPIVGLGTWQTFDVGAEASQRAPQKEVLETLVARGGKVVDSSPMYGEAERVAGDLSSELNLREKLFLATK